MGKGLAVIIFILIVIPICYAADLPVAAPLPSQQSSITPADLINGFNSMREQLQSYSDTNFATLDQRMQAFTASLAKSNTSTQQKMIIGIIGAQLLVAGLVYFLLIKNMKDLSFQSISLKRRKEVDDRNWMVDNINYLRDHADRLESHMKDTTDKMLLSLEQLANQRRDNYGGSVHPGGQPGGQQPVQFQQPPMAQQGHVQGYDSQPAQGWVSDGDQYEQQDSSSGQYGGAYYQGPESNV
jgi:hypothetical protein